MVVQTSAGRTDPATQIRSNASNGQACFGASPECPFPAARRRLRQPLPALSAETLPCLRPLRVRLIKFPPPRLRGRVRVGAPNPERLTREHPRKSPARALQRLPLGLRINAPNP